MENETLIKWKIWKLQKNNGKNVQNFCCGSSMRVEPEAKANPKEKRKTEGGEIQTMIENEKCKRKLWRQLKRQMNQMSW